MVGCTAAADAAPAVAVPMLASAELVPGSTTSTDAPAGAAPLLVSSRTCTALASVTTYGCVPPRSRAASGVPGSGSWPSSESSACHADHTPLVDVRTSNRALAGMEPSGQVAPTTEMPLGTGTAGV